MSFPTKDQRQLCWNNRDAYWECLTEYAPKHSSTSGEKVPNECSKLRKEFEKTCPRQWVKHFDRKRTYEQFKEKLEKGYDPLVESTRESTTQKTPMAAK